MKNTFRRFSAMGIAYHWCQAIPYMVLFCTGAMILLQRLLAVEVIHHETLSLVHRVAGIVLIGALGQLIILDLFTGGARRHLRTFRDTLSWRVSDLIWLAKLPLNAIWPCISLSPAGRFNPGQKLNILLVVILVSGFIVSGIGMMLVPGALAPWIIHLALMLPASALLILHHFLSLINPPTRKALGGIFTGYVPSEYVSAHHPLIAGEGNAHSHGPYVSWRSAMVMLMLIAIVVLCIVWAYGPGRIQDGIIVLWNNRGADIILPGGLCASHAKDPEASRCTACHRMLRSPPSSACLECHEIITQLADNRAGFHGTLIGECRSCHADHAGESGDIRRLDTEAFNHNLARYPLDGKHREVSCSECHLREGTGTINERTYYIGLHFDKCDECHQDPHAGQFENRCEFCHCENGWKDRWVVDAHGEETCYPLLGKHAAVECVECHPLPVEGALFAEARFFDTSTHCEQCHDDPHQAQLQASCATCHTEMGWKGRDLIFSHDQHSEFTIDAIHSSLSCSSCHTGDKTPLYRPLPESCEGCHEEVERELQGITATAAGKSDPHANRVACTKCHQPEIHSPSSAEYARICGACHNRHYEELYYDWMKSLHQRETRAYGMLKEFRERNAPHLEELERRIEEAKAVGLHNVLFARKLWDEILASAPDSSF